MIAKSLNKKLEEYESHKNYLHTVYNDVNYLEL